MLNLCFDFIDNVLIDETQRKHKMIMQVPVKFIQTVTPY